MKKAILLLFFLLIDLCSIAQQKGVGYYFDNVVADSLMDTNPFGVYFTHEEFLNGKPSIPGKFEIIERSPERQTSILSSKAIILKVFDPGSQRMKRFNDKFWCAFDENDMYLKKDADIYRLVYSGRFNICSSIQWKKKAYYNGSGTSYSTQKVVKIKVIDFKTNQWYDYSVKGMKKLLLANNKKLYNEFIIEKRKKRKVSLYFKKANSL